jgi:uncharacterized MAPEG superfamily protein
MAPTATALVGFAGWLVLLTFALALYRGYVGATTGKPLNSFVPDGSDMPGFGRRLTRARDNCYETLPVFGALALGAVLTGRPEVTNGLAPWVLGSRLVQSVTHLVSTSVPAVLLRATMLSVQLVIYAYWTIQLLR